MKNEINKQIDSILEQTSPDISNFENSVRPILNSELSDKISSILFIILEPKTFAISLIFSIVIYYIGFFISIILGYDFGGGAMLALLAFSYTPLRIIKSIKNKIK